MTSNKDLMRQAVDLARENRLRGGRPFGAILTKDGQIIATGVNNIVASQDPTTHAEMEAIRAGTRKMANPSLAGCTVYASGHPCPMCLVAMVMAGAEQVFFAFDNQDAAPYGLSSEGTYQRLRLSLNPPPYRYNALTPALRPGSSMARTLGPCHNRDAHAMWCQQCTALPLGRQTHTTAIASPLSSAASVQAAAVGWIFS